MQILEDRVTGLEAKAVEIQATIDRFNETKGLEKEKQRSNTERDELQAEIKPLKESIADLQSKKNAAIATTGKALAEAMSAVMPTGQAYFEITADGDAMIGLINDKRVRVPYHGLSGGEKATFDPALCQALKGTVILSEAAEMDNAHLADMLNQVGKLNDAQYIFATCHPPKMPADGWKVEVVK